MSIHKIIVAGALAVCAGCTLPQSIFNAWHSEPPAKTAARVATYISPALGQNPPERIVVVPFAGPSCAPEAGRMATAAVATELQAALCCDTVLPTSDDERLAAESECWRSGRVDVESLIAAQKAYLADAFLFGTVTQYKPYDPPMLGLKLRLLSARTGDVIWAAEAMFNANEQDVRLMAEQYFQNSGLNGRLYGPELVLMSPKLFADFVAVQLVRPLREQFQRKGNVASAGGAH